MRALSPWDAVILEKLGVASTRQTWILTLQIESLEGAELKAEQPHNRRLFGNNGVIWCLKSKLNRGKHHQVRQQVRKENSQDYK